MPGWTGIDLALPLTTQRASPSTDVDFARFLAMDSVAARAGLRPDEIVLLPESVFGPDDHADRLYWQALSDRVGVTVIGGGMWRRDGQRYNALWVMRPDRPARAAYAQRQPVPLSMWRPGSKDSWAAPWFGPSLAEIAGHRWGVLICYEQLLVWPAVASGMAGAEGFLLPSNLWWAGGTRIASQLEGTSTAWARLYGVPVVRAVNRGSLPP